MFGAENAGRFVCACCHRAIAVGRCIALRGSACGQFDHAIINSFGLKSAKWRAQQCGILETASLCHDRTHAPAGGVKSPREHTDFLACDRTFSRHCLKCSGSVWRAQAGRPVIASTGGAEIRPGAAAVAARCHVVERARVGIGVTAIIHRTAIRAIDAAD